MSLFVACEDTALISNMSGHGDGLSLLWAYLFQNNKFTKPINFKRLPERIPEHENRII